MKCTVFLLFWLSIGACVFAQSTGISLELPGTLPTENRNLFTFTVNPYTESRLKEISGEKYDISSVKITYNGEKVKTKSCKTRGKTTLYFERKSFSISFKDPIVLGDEKVKKIALNNLAMDRDYCRNRLSYLLLEKIGIFHLRNEFAELRINGNTAGIYLAVQKPEDFVKSKDSPLLVRRELDSDYAIEESYGDKRKDEMKRLRRIPKITREFEGQQLYDSLNAVINMEHYFQWLSFNYMVKNGDYTDELFLYFIQDENRFDIIPWDYDDIFMRQPHDGIENRNKVLDHQLLFSGESYLDIVIDKDDYLYRQFLLNFRQVLAILDEEVLKDTFEEIYRELYPFYIDKEVIAQSESDQYGLTDLSTLQADLQNHFQYLVLQRASIEMIIESELRRLPE